MVFHQLLPFRPIATGFLQQLRGWVAPLLSAPGRAQCIPSPSALLLLARRKQLNKSHFKLLTHCCPSCCSLLQSALAGRAPRLVWENGLVLGPSCRLCLSSGDQQHLQKVSHKPRCLPFVSHTHSCKGWMLALPSLSVEKRL
uniref:Uncharacterized protein n=1 Tax=Amazona collaria TaxID=241587 RepID=A0A8B9ISX1_9PSIT